MRPRAPKPPKPKGCWHCPRYFPDAASLRNHYQTEHSEFFDG